jgi:hypothetical protein
VIALSLISFAATFAAPQQQQEAPIATALASVSEDVRTYYQHVTFLANPWLEGRLPGTRGMEIARQYVEDHFAAGGLEAPFVDENGQPTYRQKFELAGQTELVSQALGTPSMGLRAGRDFTATSLGKGGEVTAPVTFVGYSIRRGVDDYSSYDEEVDDLTGKIALMLRFEPMDAEGNSLWSDRGPWSARASFSRKVRDAVRQGAAGVVIVNTPWANDPRTEELPGFRSGGQVADVPVMMVTGETGIRLVKELSGGQRDLEALWAEANRGRSVVELGGELSLNAEIQNKPLYAENVAGLVPGRGELAKELVVVGAHLDHLGMGNFGSRDRENAGKVLHPGADDNASGSAAMMMIGERLVRDYANLPEGASARSILIMCFDAEESGLNGAGHYVDNPIVPLEDHVLMLNFDMIGRIVNNRLSVSGTGTGVGMEDWARGFFEQSSLDIVENTRMSGGSDHLRFQQRDIPVMFAIIADFHDDYHTPRDTVDKINCVGAVKAMELWYNLALSMALRPERFAFTGSAGSGPAVAVPVPAEPAEPVEAPSRSTMSVRFGIMPGSYDADAEGVLVGSVSPGGSAAEAGIQADDRLIKWNGDAIENVSGWMAQLAEHQPGDKVKVTVARGNEELEMEVTLQAKSSDG